MIEKNELTLFGIDPKCPEKLIETHINEDFPLYPLLAFLQNVAKNPQASQPSFIRCIQEMQNETLEKISKMRPKLNTSDVKVLERCIDWIGNTLDQTIKSASPSNQAKIVEVNVCITKALIHHLIKKHQKQKFHRFMGHFLSDQLLVAAILCFKADQFQLVETYCLKHLAHLATLPNNDLADMRKREFLAHLLLASIYLKFGYTKSALHSVKKFDVILNKNAYAADNDILDIFLDVYKNIIVNAYNGNPLKVFKLYANFIFSKNFVANNTKQAKTIQFIDLVFSQAKNKYQKQFADKIANLPGTAELVENFVFDFNKNFVTLHFKNPDLNHFFIEVFEQKQMGGKQLEGANPNSWFQFSIHLCSAEALEKVCQTVLALQKQKEETVNFTPVSSIDSAQCTHTVLPLVVQPQITITATTSFSTPLFQPAADKSIKIKPMAQQNSAITSPKPARPKTVCYQWASGLKYDSREQNQGVVKMLVNDFIPAGVWFGYIPQWLTEDPHFDAEFSRKLTRGLITHDCIRDITKELQTWNNQNFSVDHPYKFKIVVKNHDYRVYGWIDEVLVGEDGKKHYLVCFGYLANHKANYLPNPETLKEKLSEEKTLKM